MGAARRSISPKRIIIFTSNVGIYQLDRKPDARWSAGDRQPLLNVDPDKDIDYDVVTRQDSRRRAEYFKHSWDVRSC